MDNKIFTDRVKITVKAGNGGDGMNSFKAYKGKPACGPDGGDGGDGGSVYLLGDRNTGDLLAYRYVRKYAAGDGARGGTNLCAGARGADVVLKVPCGTLVREAESGRIVCDVFEDGEKILLLSGGRGGKGNARFTTARRHAPNFSQKGVLVKAREIVLEMKVIADAGLVGFPNVGKSTLLSKVTAARPKIADYHFTTLSPNLGVAERYGERFTVADIPGLIEGASQGAGLGHDFLRHVERTRMLVHVVDISGVEGRDPKEDFRKVNAELAAYSQKLADLPQFVVCNKCDIYGARENLKAFCAEYGEKYRIFPVAAITGEGTGELLDAICGELKALPPRERIPADEFLFDEREDDRDFEIVRGDDGAYYIEGGLADLLCRNVVMSNPDSMAYFQRVLRDRGVVKALVAAGCKEGDVVVLGETEFDFVP